MFSPIQPWLAERFRHKLLKGMLFSRGHYLVIQFLRKLTTRRAVSCALGARIFARLPAEPDLALFSNGNGCFLPQP